MKNGIEVEGRFKGVPTVFVGVSEIRKLTTLDLTVYNHIYVSDLNCELTEDDFKFLKSFIYFNKMIVLEVSTVKHIPSWMEAHIVLNVVNEDFFKLKETDQIKFEKELTVYMTTKEVMVKTNPEDFEGDEEIE